MVKLKLKIFFKQNILIYIYFLVIVPHIGSATIQTRNDMATTAALNVLKGITGEEMVSPVP